VDGEVVGYLVPSGGGGLVAPTSLIGLPLGPPQSPETVAAVLEREGLAVLARRWWCRLQTPLPEAGCDPTERRASWAWRPVVEVRPTRCVVRPEFPVSEERTQTVALPVPVGDLLAADPPV
jgi:hypothetical protein